MAEWSSAGNVPATGADTKLLGVIGWPIGHSLSPKMHAAAIHAEGLDAVYLAFAVHSSRLEAAVAGLEALGAVGFSVTAPYKAAVLPFLSGTTPLAAGLGAVNTVFRGADGELIGDNTDVGGVREAILSSRGPLEGGHAVVLGAGGAAAAAVVALAESGARRVTILARRPEPASALARRARASRLCGDVQIESGELDDQSSVLEDAAVLVQATAAPTREGPGVDPSRCPKGALAVEMAYDGRKVEETAFSAQARRAGLLTVDGVRILLEQGVLAWERWLGRTLTVTSIESMFEQLSVHGQTMPRSQA